MSETPNSLVEALYEKFLLRDVFGKIAPGMITLGALAYVIYPKLTSLVVTKMEWPLLAMAVPIAWLASLVIQSAGEKIRYIRLWPDAMKDPLVRYARRNAFMERATPSEKQQALRFELIAESSGIFGAACLLVAILLVFISLQAQVAVAGPDAWWRHLCLSAWLFLSSYLLRVHHILHTTKRYDYYKSVVDKKH